MPRQWYYGQHGQQLGPITEEQLRSLANSGQLQPTDLIWAKGMPNWVPAQTIMGVTFPASEMPPPIPGAPAEEPVQATLIDEPQHTGQRSPVAPSATDNDFVAKARMFWNQYRENPIFIGALFVLCFPVALYLVWKHSTWTNKTKWIWTGAWAAFMVIGMTTNHEENGERGGARPSSKEAAGEAPIAAHEFSEAELSEVLSDANLRIAYQMGHLDQAKLENYRSLKQAQVNKGIFHGTAEYMTLLMLVPSQNWFDAAHQRGLSRLEFQQTTRLLMASAGALPPSQVTNEASYEGALYQLTGKHLQDY